MQQIAGFVSGNQQKLPATIVEHFRTALIALPQTGAPFEINAGTKEIRPIPRARFAPRARQDVTRILANFDYQAFNSNGADPRKKADAYLAFAARYPTVLMRSELTRRPSNQRKRSVTLPRRKRPSKIGLLSSHRGFFRFSTWHGST